MGAPGHKVTEETQKMVENASGIGLPHEQIATLIGITDKTLRKRYRRQLDSGKAKANMQIGSTLYTEAKKGNPTLLIWWTKTQMGWKSQESVQLSTPPGQPLEHSHTYGSPELLKTFYAASQQALAGSSVPSGAADLGQDQPPGD